MHSPSERRLLRQLGTEPTAMATLLDGTFGTQAEVMQAADALGPELIVIDEVLEVTSSLTAEGLATQQLPERRALGAILAAGGSIAMAKLAAAEPQTPVAVGWLKRKGWATMEKGPEGPMLIATTDAPADADELALAALRANKPMPKGENSLVKRGLVELQSTTRRAFSLTPAGVEVQSTLPAEDGEEVSQITPEMVARWSEMSADEKAAITLRPFAFEVEGTPTPSAKPHPLSRLMAQVRQVFWSMGFQEIRGDYVESAYWNMDALYIPQDHPAREMQDTFYLQNPARIDVDADALAKAAKVHQDGGDTGSTGWGGDFDTAVSQRALLRTHTTNTTVRYLANAYGKGGDKNSSHKVFGLGRVFRKETMDATHLPEFTQIEGIVAEEGASFDGLVGMCRHFFAAMGFPEVRFRPAYFPYTEPSMEIEVYYNGRWMELGGCGVFRPEVTEPLGVPHRVLAWGFGLERLAMMRLGLKDIRQLYVSDVDWLRDAPIL